MKFSRLALVIACLVLTACGLSPQQKADYLRVQNSGVNSAVYDKMLHNDDLSLYDIKALVRAHVDDGIIMRYLRDQHTVYSLNSEDVANLRRANVSQSIVDYMLTTPQLQGPDYYPAIGIGYGYGPYWGDPYWGPPYPCYPYAYRHWH